MKPPLELTLKFDGRDNAKAVNPLTEIIDSELRYRRLFEAARDGILILDVETGRIDEVNPFLMELLGFSRDEMVGKTVGELSPFKDVLSNQTMLERLQAVGYVRYEDLPLQTRDGRKIAVEFVCNVYQVGDQRVIQCNIRDITERKRTEAALQSSEKRFNALFDQMAVGVALADIATGRFVQVNRRYCEIAGYSREEMDQLTFAAITHPKDIDYDLEMVRRMKAGTIREYTHEKRHVRKDHSEIWVSLTVSAMWAQGETPDMSIIVVQDITGRKQLEEQVLQAQKMEAVGTLAGGIAHDFNNILAAIIGYTEISLRTLAGNTKVREHLAAVLIATNRATHLVRQILTFSRQQSSVRKPVLLGPVVAECIALLRATIPVSIEFDTSLAPDAPAVLADTAQIHQILMNLGTNAWHAMKDRPGRLQVKLEQCEVDEAHAARQSRLRPGIYARVSIGDTGCGMDQATLLRIFEPFFTTKSPGEGTGLGLAVVHGIMDNHDGAVTVHSNPGQGTVFHLYFPKIARADTPPVFPVEPVPRGHGERILVVDDESMLVQLTETVLIELGYEVEGETRPEAALALVRSDPERFALVLTDQTMPGMTGLILAAQLQLIRPGLPVILTTGYIAALTKEQVKTAGIRQLLHKPATLLELGVAIQAALAADN